MCYQGMSLNFPSSVNAHRCHRRCQRMTLLFAGPIHASDPCQRAIHLLKPLSTLRGAFFCVKSYDVRRCKCLSRIIHLKATLVLQAHCQPQLHQFLFFLFFHLDGRLLSVSVTHVIERRTRYIVHRYTSSPEQDEEKHKNRFTRMKNVLKTEPTLPSSCFN